METSSLSTNSFAGIQKVFTDVDNGWLTTGNPWESIRVSEQAVLIGGKAKKHLQLLVLVYTLMASDSLQTYSLCRPTRVYDENAERFYFVPEEMSDAYSDKQKALCILEMLSPWSACSDLLDNIKITVLLFYAFGDFRLESRFRVKDSFFLLPHIFFCSNLHRLKKNVCVMLMKADLLPFSRKRCLFQLAGSFCSSSCHSCCERCSDLFISGEEAER